jgi:glycosyltransferase involved in cell wall biosynthesis
VVYLTDGMVRDWRYAVWRAAGVQRIVVHDHTPGTRSVPRGLRRTAKQLLCRLPIVTADALIGATPFVRARHVESTCFPAARCHIAENGLPMRGAVDAVDVHARFAIPGDRHVAVVVGRADRIKGVEVAIDAVAQLVNRGRHDVHLLHVGDGPDLDRFRARAERLGVSAFVTFAGRQDGVPGILRGCAIAIHPSFAEVGYSLAILESMEAGLPVLVSDDPSVCGATEHGVTGLHVRTGDPTALATALAALLDDGGLRRRLGAAAAAQLQARFTLAHTHRQLGEAMDRIVDAPVRPSAAAA